MKNIKIKGVSFVVIFVILLIVVTVFSWKSCSQQVYDSSIQRSNTQTSLAF